MSVPLHALQIILNDILHLSTVMISEEHKCVWGGGREMGISKLGNHEKDKRK